MELNNRTRILYALIKEFVRDEMGFLDIGCGHPKTFQGNKLPEFIHEDFPRATYLGIDIDETVIEFNKKDYPYYNWLCRDASKYPVIIMPDFVIHVGFNKWWDESWKLHYSLYPEYVLLESGAPLQDGHSIHQQIYQQVKTIYLRRKYEIVQEGSYIWTAKVNQQLRFFTVLEGEKK